MLAFDEILAINFGNTKIDDETLAPLLKLPALQKIELRQAQVTDA